MNGHASFPMTLKEFTEKLSRHFSYPVEIVLKDNRSTYLHVIDHKKKKIKLLIHNVFLCASEKICDAIAKYVLNDDKQSLALVRRFAYEHLSKADYTHHVGDKQISVQGFFYDLEEIFNRLNERYFSKKIDCRITWFSSPRYTRWSHFTLGTYHDSMKLIRINKLLDDPYIPPYFLSYIIYHEMVHHMIPTYIDEKGRKKSHTKEFKRLEQGFLYFSHAMYWEKKYLNTFLRRKKKAYQYGRT